MDENYELRLMLLLECKTLFWSLVQWLGFGRLASLYGGYRDLTCRDCLAMSIAWPVSLLEDHLSFLFVVVVVGIVCESRLRACFEDLGFGTFNEVCMSGRADWLTSHATVGCP